MTRASNHPSQTRERVLSDWLEVLSQLEDEQRAFTEAGESLPKEFVDKLKIASVEIRVSVKELSDRRSSELPGSHEDEGTPSLDRLKIVS